MVLYNKYYSSKKLSGTLIILLGCIVIFKSAPVFAAVQEIPTDTEQAFINQLQNFEEAIADTTSTFGQTDKFTVETGQVLGVTTSAE